MDGGFSASAPTPTSTKPPSASSAASSAPSLSPSGPYAAAASSPPAPPSPTSLPPVGKEVALTLRDGKRLRGFVHALDRHAGLLCLEEAGTGAASILPFSSLHAWDPLPQPPPRKWPPHPTVDVARVRAEEDRIFRRRHAEFAQVGVGVSPAAQAVFDALAKTLPCKWQRDTIVILDSVALLPPYDPASLPADADPGLVNRVRMILDREAPAIKHATAAAAATTNTAAGPTSSSNASSAAATAGSARNAPGTSSSRPNSVANSTPTDAPAASPATSKVSYASSLSASNSNPSRTSSAKTSASITQAASANHSNAALPPGKTPATVTTPNGITP